MATRTAPAAWWGEDDETLATVLSILADRAERSKRRR